MHQLSASVVSNEPSSSAYYTMVLEAPAIAAVARAGQFIMASAGPQTFLKRPMGLSGANPAAGTIEFIYQVVGQGTKNLTGFQIGDAIDVLGPLGTAFEPITEAKRMVLVGGGTGTGPLMMLARTLRLLADPPTVQLVFGARRAKMFVDVSELAALGVTVQLSTDDGSAGTKGTVIDVLGPLLADQPTDQLFSCGPDRMMAAVAQLAATRQIPCQVSLEARMACGFGACLGCACKRADGSYGLACVDGPVMDAEEVTWQ